MSEPSYAVEVAAAAQKELERLSDSERAEVLTALTRLEKRPLPGGRSGVIRLRGRMALGQPLFYSYTPHFGLYHIVTENRVLVLVIAERPQLLPPEE